MTQEEINKGSRLIESIMGSTIKIEQDDVKDIPLAFLQPEDMKFHESWKWLMPVVVKIEDDMGHTVLIEGNRCTVTTGSDSYEAQADTKLRAVWQAIVDFLEAENG